MLKAIIFDFDGLILDTEGIEYAAWQETYQAHGCSVPLDVWVPLIGSVGHGWDPCEHLEGILGRSLDRERIRAERRRRMLEKLCAEPPLPGVTETLAAAERLGLSVGLASSSPRSWVMGHLTRLRLEKRFDLVRCSDDVHRTKPDPELYLSVLAGLGVRGAEAIAVEDSLNGMRAAQAAGIFCVVVPNTLTRHLPLEGADLLLSSLADLRLEHVAATLPA